MTTIHIAYEVSSEALARVQEFLEHETDYNPNWNGAKFNLVL